MRGTILVVLGRLRARAGAAPRGAVSADRPAAHGKRRRRDGHHLRTPLALALALVACGGDDDGGNAATEAMVLETCAPGRDDPIEVEVCECAFDELQERFDAEALEDLDRQLRDDPETVPPEVQEAVLGCASERVAPPTTKQPTTSSSTSSSSTSTTTEP